MKRHVYIATILIVMTTASVAAADDEVRPATDSSPLGGPGRWVFDLFGGQWGGGLGTIGFVGPFLLSSTSREVAAPASTSHQTVLALTPSADTFVTERFSVGGRASAGLLSTKETDTVVVSDVPSSLRYESHGYTLGLAPRVGYVIPLSSSFAFWPRVGGGFEISRQAYEGPQSRVLTRAYFVESNLGVVLRVSKHALFDIGPVLAYRRSETASADTTESFNASLRVSLRLDF